MQVKRPDDFEKKFWFPTTEDPGNESEHSPIQRRILKELRELAELENQTYQKRTIPNQIPFNVHMDRFTNQREGP